MERRLMLVDVMKKGTLVAGATSGAGLASAQALSDQSRYLARFARHPSSGRGLTEEPLREMAEQVRLLSATVDSLLRPAE